MKLQDLDAEQQDGLFMDLTTAVVATVVKELYAKGYKDVADQSSALMNVCCNIIAAEVSLMPEENRKYVLDKIVYGIIESQIPTLNDKYMNAKDNRD